MADAEVLFITVGTAAARHESSFKRTFQACQDADLEPQLLDVSAAACTSSAGGGGGGALTCPKDSAVYVFDAFEGEAFERLQVRRCRVYGLPCVQQCLDRGESLPKVGHPVYSFSMRGAVVCCTSVPAEQRTRLHRLVQYMGGEVSGNFTEAVTHLVALGVGSMKYEVAAARKLPVLMPDWILAAWQRCCCGRDDDDGRGSGNVTDEGGGAGNEPASALAPAFAARFACPVFKGLTVTTSALPNRKALRELIERNGGVFAGEMRAGECTHLVVNEPTGAKYEHAKLWNIVVVRPQWLHDCVQAGYRLVERPYAFDGRQQASTPNGSATATAAAGVRLPAILDISAIGAANASAAALANVTVQSCDGSSSSSAAVAPAAMARDPLDEIKVVRTGFFLDGCRVYAHGFAAPRLDKVRKLIDSSGAVRVGSLAQKPSHVLVADGGGAQDGLAAALRAAAPAPHLVSVAWLVECVKQEKLLDATPFAVCLPPLGAATALLSSSASSLSSSRCATTPIKPPPPGPSKGEPVRKPLAVCNEANSSAAGSAAAAAAATAGRRSTSAASAAAKSGREKDLDIISQYSSGWSADESAFAKAVPSQPSSHIATATDAAAATSMACGSPALVAPAAAVSAAAALPVATTAQSSGGVNNREPPACGKVADVVGVTAAAAVTADLSAGSGSTLLDSDRSLLEAARQPVVPPEAHGAAGGVPCLQGASIAFRGFAEDDLALLKSLVTENGGVFVGVEAATAGSYVVLPLEGCSTAAAAPPPLPPPQPCTVATVTWLQSCLETGRLLPVGDCPLFSPVGVAAGSSPLAGCVVSVSGFVGAVREAVYHVVQLAGGQPQENLAKKATSTVKATTHLIVSEPSGRKYSAAKAWAIPALPLAWLLDCARLGSRQPEADYAAAVATAAAAAAAAADSSKQESKSATAADVVHRAAAASAPAREAAAAAGASATADVGRAVDRHGEGRTHPDRTAEGRGKPDAASVGPSDTAVGGAAAPGNAGSDAAPLCTSAAAIASAPATAPVAATPARLSSRARGSGSMLPPPPATSAASATGSRRLVEASSSSSQLGGRAVDMTPMTKSRKLGIDTPSKWLDPDASFHPGFDLGCISADACAPAAAADGASDSGRGSRRSSLPMEELLSKHLHLALEGQQQEQQELEPPEAQRSAPQAAWPAPPAGDKSATAGAQQRRSRQQPLSAVPAAVAAVAADAAGASGGSAGGPAAVRRSARLHSDAGTAASFGAGDASASRQQQPAGDSSQGAARAALSDQLQSFISTTKKPSKTDRRRSRRRAMSAAAADDDGSKLSAGCNRENLYGVSSSGGSRAASGADSAPGDPSQRVQVMWDDAISREEARKLAEHLDRASCPMDDYGQSTVDAIKKLLHEQHQQGAADVDGHRGDTGADDGGSSAADSAATSSRRHVFLLSGLSAEERDGYGAIVHGLGGALLDSPAFDERCTHLVVSKPTRNEKFLACVATGKWILHPSYFDACSQASCFVDEARYEWGGPGLVALCQQLGEATAKLASAAHRRRRLAATATAAAERDGGSGSSGSWAFANWRAVLCTEEAKEGGFRRLLEAGGATVVAARPPFDGLRAGDVSHAFVDLRKTAYSAADFEPLLRMSVPCLRPDYLASFLTEEALPSIRDFQVAELRSAAADVSTSSVGGKRRLLTTANSSSVSIKKPR